MSLATGFSCLSSFFPRVGNEEPLTPKSVDASFCLRLGVSGRTGSIFFWSDDRDEDEDERDKDMRTVPMRRTYGNSKQWVSTLFHPDLSSFPQETTIRRFSGIIKPKATHHVTPVPGIPAITIITSEKKTNIPRS